ncbi:MAG: DUF4926 domain-containing protein [Isosphaeraceae bacterium]
MVVTIACLLLACRHYNRPPPPAANSGATGAEEGLNCPEAYSPGLPWIQTCGLPESASAEPPGKYKAVVFLAALGLTSGEVGAVVETPGDGEGFEVEFCDNTGQTYGLHTPRPNQIMALHNRGQALRLHVEAA